MFCNALTVDPVWAVTLCNTMDAQGVDEEELRQHLDEQRAALEQVQQALAAEPSEELEEVSAVVFMSLLRKAWQRVEGYVCTCHM